MLVITMASGYLECASTATSTISSQRAPRNPHAHGPRGSLATAWHAEVLLEGPYGALGIPHMLPLLPQLQCLSLATRRSCMLSTLYTPLQDGYCAAPPAPSVAVLSESQLCHPSAGSFPQSIAHHISLQRAITLSTASRPHCSGEPWQHGIMLSRSV